MISIKQQDITIHQALEAISTKEYVLPSFQRNYVWTKNQIISLFDSIMTGYPISSFLFLNLEKFDKFSNSYFCKFLENVNFNFQGKADMAESQYIDPNALHSSKFAVLDGQQRLTSLFVTLFGQTQGREKFARIGGPTVHTHLYIDLNSKYDEMSDKTEYEDNEEEQKIEQSENFSFEFAFASKTLTNNWIKVKELLRLGVSSKENRQTEINNILSGRDKIVNIEERKK